MNRLTMRFLPLMLSIFLVPAVAEKVEFRSKVMLSVSASESIKNLIVSYFGREFRSLGDIDIVSVDPKTDALCVDVVALELTNKSGIKTGAVITVGIYYRFDPDIVARYLPENLNEAIGKYLFSEWCSSPDIWVRTGGLEDIQQMCSEIVADIDTKYLQYSRNFLKL
ncbi:MAG: hypothetical protein AMQ22_01561 [Candidatus Methanofastidiosum methylothiophilum]|jgi:hypothetical protein|uniref:Uncharacterized protein n=1 Tax=Candidatus Methanofastidiosum methylothiophilum TaxID=1705564 RepID=A0A150IXX0_9EURY|nr:MAG: hypothetical protein AMQ22_01561 [Candidatus Methanofastidiosum methylthiophilus]